MTGQQFTCHLVSSIQKLSKPPLLRGDLRLPPTTAVNYRMVLPRRFVDAPTTQSSTKLVDFIAKLS
ncbi:hypothetical protein TMatcc_007067 [Talaromyces marneffei ATCC 18224]